MKFDEVVQPESVGMDGGKIGELDRIIDAQVAEGLSPGMQVVIARHGQAVLDKAIGLARLNPAIPVTPHTLFYSWSVAKPITAMSIHLLAERGKLGLDDPIMKSWPAFGQNGKERVTIRHVLGHRGGFPTTPDAVNRSNLEDWNTAVRLMEELPLEWEAGTAIEYHSLNFGWVLGEVVRRVDGRPIEVFARDEFFKPLGMSDSYLKITDAELDRTAQLVVADGYEEGARSAKMFNRPAARRAVIPAAGMHTTAHDLARFYQMMLNGGELEGVRVLQAGTIEQACAPSFKPGDRERKSNKPAHRGHGLDLGGHVDCVWGGAKTRQTTFGHNGYATNVSFADKESGVICIILNNGMQPDKMNNERLRQICDKVWQACEAK
jgi:CubicO group peptidase (beta-lactamase class C family)